jgi:hypothetical protein
LTGWKHAALAAAVAYALVVQALFLSFSGGVHAGMLRDGSGVLCVQDSRSAPDHQPSDAHGGLCCVMGCHGSASAGPVPVQGAFERLAPLVLAVAPPAGARPSPASFSNVLPLGSRAPPRLG